MILKDKRCYLSGPIQFDTSDVNWRIPVKKCFVEQFGIDVFDPFDDPKQQWVPALKKAQEEGDYDTIVSTSKKFVRKDLCMVDRSDFLVAYLPSKVPTTGTVHEIINSNNAKKPTLLVTDLGSIAGIPLWYYGFIPLEFMFFNWESLYSYLEKVNSACDSVHKRWSFIQGKI